MAKRNSRFTRVRVGDMSVRRRSYRVKIGGIELPVRGNQFYVFIQAGVLILAKETTSLSVAVVSPRHRAYVDQIVGDLHGEAADKSYVHPEVARALSSWLGKMIRDYALAA